MSLAGPAPDSDAGWLLQLCTEAQEETETLVAPPALPEDLCEGLCNAGWFVNTRLAAEAGENRRTVLRCEYQDLVREARAERSAAEELQASLSAEMRQLRDQAQQQGRNVGMLVQRLVDARHAVTGELRGAAARRAQLGADLAAEEAQRVALEETWRNEEAEVGGRVEAAEQQLATMTAVRDSLVAQLSTSLRSQNELRAQIACERSGRSELEVAGEREMAAWNEHNSMLYGELRHRLQAERSEVDTWRADVSRELSLLQQECLEREREEETMELRLRSAKSAHDELESTLRAEAYAWSLEVERLRERTRQLDEECWSAADTAQRCRAALGACGLERTELQEEMQKCVAAARTGGTELERLEQRSRFLREELHQVQEGVARWKHDEEAGRLCQQRDDLVRQIQEATQFQSDLQGELEEVKGRGIISCMFGSRRQAGPPAPLPPPASPPPARRNVAQASPYQTTEGRGVKPLVRLGEAAHGHGGLRCAGAPGHIASATLADEV